MDSIVLACSILASLAIGVLGAYGLCLAMFHVFRIHARQVQQQRQSAAPATVRPAA